MEPRQKKFQVGDKVIYKREEISDYPWLENVTGTVCNIYNDKYAWVGVQWDVPIVDLNDDGEAGHDCDGTCIYGRGWNVGRRYLHWLSEFDKEENPTENLNSIL